MAQSTISILVLGDSVAATPEQVGKDLGKVLSGGAADVLTDIFTRIAFSTDSSIYQICRCVS